ncbi:MAG: hypothetical protein ACRC80_07410, partial [Waterburya sp.]
EEGTFRSASGPLYGRKDLEVLKELQDQLNEIDRLTKSIEAGQKRIRNIEENIGKTEANNRRNLRFETVNQDRNRRSAAQDLDSIKEEKRIENQLRQDRKNKLSIDDVSLIFQSNKLNRKGSDRLFEITQESNAEKKAIDNRLAEIKKEGEEERRILDTKKRDRRDDLSDRLNIYKKESEAIQVLGNSIRKDSILEAKQDFERQQYEDSRAKSINRFPKETTKKQNISLIETQVETPSQLTDILATVLRPQKQTSDLQVERLSQIRKESEATKKLQEQQIQRRLEGASSAGKGEGFGLTQRLELAKSEGIQNRTSASQLNERLSQIRKESEAIDDLQAQKEQQQITSIQSGQVLNQTSASQLNERLSQIKKESEATKKLQEQQ